MAEYIYIYMCVCVNKWIFFLEIIAKNYEIFLTVSLLAGYSFKFFLNYLTTE